jgi:catechol 2,3-dioxygenase-like lactoylglutathione lyase family enzyme
MIGYVTLGFRDIARAQAFYDALLATIGAKRLMETPEYNGFTLYGTDMGRPGLALTRPYDGGEASVGNGTMVAFPVREREQVDAFHAKALELGGTDEGAPGQRTPDFYGAYFRDPDGHKLCVFAAGPA